MANFLSKLLPGHNLGSKRFIVKEVGRAAVMAPMAVTVLGLTIGFVTGAGKFLWITTFLGSGREIVIGGSFAGDLGSGCSVLSLTLP